MRSAVVYGASSHACALAHGLLLQFPFQLLHAPVISSSQASILCIATPPHSIYSLLNVPIHIFLLVHVDTLPAGPAVVPSTLP